MSDRHSPPDLSGSAGETLTTVKMSENMKAAWMNYCEGMGWHHRVAIRHLIEMHLRMIHTMPMEEMLTDPKKNNEPKRHQ